MQPLSGLKIPDFHIFACADGQHVPPWIEGQRMNDGIGTQRILHLAALDVPDDYGAVLTSGLNRLTILPVAESQRTTVWSSLPDATSWLSGLNATAMTASQCFRRLSPRTATSPSGSLSGSSRAAAFRSCSGIVP